MASLREYFDRDFSELNQGLEWTVSPRAADWPGPGAVPAPVTVTARVHSNDTAFARFVTYFISADVVDAQWALGWLVTHPELVVKEADGTVLATMSHPVYDPEGLATNDIPFSGRVFLYADSALPSAVRAELLQLAKGRGLALQIRDEAYRKYRSDQESPLAFICHDSCDKEDLVRPLSRQLQMMLCPVWYDEYSLKPGDSLREGIDRGLNSCPKCIVVLSKAFLSNPGWAKGEFNAIVSRHFAEGGSILLPIWHGVTREDVAQYSALAADIVALKSTLGLEELARQVFRAVGG